MKYIVLTAKHCDGFLLWDFKVDDYNITHTPFQRNVCAELQQGELRELLTNDGSVDLLWFDYDGREAMCNQACTYALVKKLQPRIVLNNRLDLDIGNNNRQILSPFTDYTTPEQADFLRDMGAWLAQYGDSIYGTRGGPFKPERFKVSTRKDQTNYLHVRRWPQDVLTLPAIPAKVVRSVVLTGGRVTVKQDDDGIEVSVPAGDRQAIDTIVALELDRSANDIAPIDVSAASSSLTTRCKAMASNVYQRRAQYGAATVCSAVSA